MTFHIGNWARMSVSGNEPIIMLLRVSPKQAKRPWDGCDFSQPRQHPCFRNSRFLPGRDGKSFAARPRDPEQPRQHRHVADQPDERRVHRRGGTSRGPVFASATASASTWPRVYFFLRSRARPPRASSVSMPARGSAPGRSSSRRGSSSPAASGSPGSPPSSCR